MNWMLWVGIGCMIAGVLLVVFACMTAAKRSDEWMERQWDRQFNDLEFEIRTRDHERFLREHRSDGGQDD